VGDATYRWNSDKMPHPRIQHPANLLAHMFESVL
jgi:hypothetical protein